MTFTVLQHFSLEIELLRPGLVQGKKVYETYGAREIFKLNIFPLFNANADKYLKCVKT